MPRQRLDDDQDATDNATAQGTLHTKYRPATLDDVIGQDATVKSLKALLKTPKTANHTYLFTGPAGTGKTTLARIMAAQFGAAAETVIEVDAASNSGVEDVRKLCEGLQYKGFGASATKAIIIDECHRLSANAWDALLKVTEEPPAHVYFFFCSTEPGKVRPAMRTRAADYALKSVRYDDIMDLLDKVCGQEDLRPAKGVLELVADSCGGSPRLALTMLAKVASCADADDAAELLATAINNPEVIDLCRLLVSGRAKWADVVKMVKALEDVQAEGIRIVVVNYLNSCLVGAKSDGTAQDLLDMQAPFLKPMNPADKMAPLYQAFGRVIFG